MKTPTQKQINYIENHVDYMDIQKENKKHFEQLKFVCFGDSITSDEVSKIGTYISDSIGTILIKNFAHGNATCSDWYNNQDGNITIETLEMVYKDNDLNKSALSVNYNVLSNQIRRYLCYSTNVGCPVTYHHPIDGDFTLNTSIWDGNGSDANVPDIIYIAIGINDGQTNNITIDDTEIIFSQEYSQLNRCGFASSLRWAIETLLSAYPNTQIFVTSPLQTGGAYNRINFSNTLLKRNIIKKVCRFCSVNFIDSFSESGFNKMLSHGISSWETDTVHPKNEFAKRIAKYVSNKIINNYIFLISLYIINLVLEKLCRQRQQYNSNIF